jgi:hypothetical protein
MNRGASLIPKIVAILCVAVPANRALAQQMHQTSFNTTEANTEYTKQLVIDVEDVRGHQIRLFEIRRTFPKDPPVINGVKLAETWTRGMSDFIDTTGPSTSYVIFVLENGDKFFANASATSESTVKPDGSSSYTVTLEGTLTGGTGTLAGITGVVRTANVFDPKTGFNEGQTEIEYSLGIATNGKK